MTAEAKDKDNNNSNKNSNNNNNSNTDNNNTDNKNTNKLPKLGSRLLAGSGDSGGINSIKTTQIGLLAQACFRLPM